MFYIDLDTEYPQRFCMPKFVDFEENAYDILMSYFMRKIGNMKVFGYYDVTGEENRPDLVSYNIYGYTMYWWILMIFNGLVDFSQVTLGLRIKYPSIDELEELYFTLNNQSKAGLNQ